MQPRSLKFIRSLGLRFWLFLPVLSGLAWIVSGWATDLILTRSSVSDKAFILESASESPVILVRAVEVVIQEEFSIVTVFTRNQPLSRLEFRFPYTERDQLEKAIAQVLGLSRSQVNQVTRYNRLK